MRAGFLLALALLVAPTVAAAQGVVQQAGPVVPFHVPVWFGNGVVGDGGAPNTPAVNSLGLFNGANCPFGVSSQTNPGASTTAGAQLTICQSATQTIFNVAGVNGQPTPSVLFDIGGTLYPFPGPGGGTVIGPSSSVVGHVACWNSTNGTIIEDCGTLPGAPGGNANDLQFKTGATTFGGNDNIQATGPSTAATGLNVHAVAPNVATNNTDAALAQFNTSAASAASVNFGFSDVDLIDGNHFAQYGMELYDSGPPVNDSKTTFALSNLLGGYTAAGQHVGMVTRMICAGVGDCAPESQQTYFGSGSDAGGEGQGAVINHITQQYVLPTATVASATTSACNTTITGPITANTSTPQTFAVASGAACPANEWAIVHYQAATGSNSEVAIYVTAQVGNNITAVVPINVPSGGTWTLTPAVLVTATAGLLDWVGDAYWGQGRWVADTTVSPVTAGNVASISGAGATGSGTSWSTSMVGGTSTRPGMMALTPDTTSTNPSGQPIEALLPIVSVTDSTHLVLFSYSVAGDTSYKGLCVSTCAYKIRPGSPILIPPGVSFGDIGSPGTLSTQFVTDTAFYTAGDTIEETVSPWADVNGLQTSVDMFLPGATNRGIYTALASGSRMINSAFSATNAGYYGTGDADPYAYAVVFSDGSGRGKVFAQGSAERDGINLTSLSGSSSSDYGVNVTSSGGGSAVAFGESGFGCAFCAADSPPTLIATGGELLMSGTAPTIASGFGTGGAIGVSNGTTAFTITVGTSNGGSGVITLPTARTGWICQAQDESTTTANVFVTRQIAHSTTSCSLANFAASGSAHDWVDGDVLLVTAFAF